jgi:phosphatidate cytidylyltransferase
MGVVAVSLRRAGEGHVLLKRILSAVVLVPVVVWIVAGAPPWIFQWFVVVLSAAASWELCHLFQGTGRVARPWLTALCAAVVTASFIFPGAPVAALAVTTGLILAASLWIPSGPSSDAVVIGLTSLCYIGVLMGHALLLHQLADGRALILFLLAVTWAGETAAYLVGSAIGRHKLAPKISPGKTVEGAAGQLLASVVAAWALAGLVPRWSSVETSMAGLLLGAVGQVGDLAESVIKRSVGAKEAGNVFPGHGGLLDRIDGLLFNTPALFYYAGVLGGRA